MSGANDISFLTISWTKLEGKFDVSITTANLDSGGAELRNFVMI
jgi:hypothetical protein